MRAIHDSPSSNSAFADDPSDAFLRGRLGAELARVYSETLTAPLPSALSALVERLARALNDHAREAD